MANKYKTSVELLRRQLFLDSFRVKSATVSHCRCCSKEEGKLKLNATFTLNQPLPQLQASLTLNLGTNGLKVTSEPPPKAGQAVRIASGHQSKQQPQ
ncbi:hypothetical protein J6590_058376 [Homalodisca vitripennis]|nr:hypothetical protein J6590_058376 [Homalodisca vitripennis]